MTSHYNTRAGKSLRGRRELIGAYRDTRKAGFGVIFEERRNLFAIPKKYSLKPYVATTIDSRKSIGRIVHKLFQERRNLMSQQLAVLILALAYNYNDQITN